jgi:hypothetical protein
MCTQIRLALNLLERNYCASLGVPEKPHDVTTESRSLHSLSRKNRKFREQCLFCRFCLIS